MKIARFLLAAAFAAIPALAAPTEKTEAQRITLNGFRGPSIGLEYQKGMWSWHAGFYPTVLSMDDARDRKTTWFTRGGLTWWPTSWAFVDASTLVGMNLDYRRDVAYMLNPGLQYLVMDRVALRLGVAALFSSGHEAKINPAPGIGLSFPVSL